MACLLLRLALTVPVKTIAGLSCNIETLSALRDADVALEQSTATACVTLDSLIHSETACDNNVTLSPGGKEVQAYRLYNETHGSNLLTLASYTMSECTCPVLDFQCKQRCVDMSALRTINSEVRTSIFQLHEKRSAAAQQVRREYAHLITAASHLLERECISHEEECELVETLSTPAALKHA